MSATQCFFHYLNVLARAMFISFSLVSWPVCLSVGYLVVHVLCLYLSYLPADRPNKR